MRNFKFNNLQKDKQLFHLFWIDTGKICLKEKTEHTKIKITFQFQTSLTSCLFNMFNNNNRSHNFNKKERRI